ncbi:hypothetical protein [Streptomyces mirabilis]
MKHVFGRETLPHWAEFLVLSATIYPADRLYSLTLADRFTEWNEWLRPLPFTLEVLVLLVFIVMPGAAKLWRTLHASTAE